MGEHVKDFGQFVNEGIDKEAIFKLQDYDQELPQQIEDAYYGISDHLDNLVEYLKEAAGNDSDWKEELKIWEQIQKLETKSKIGKFL